ncbi:hypothetical protein BDN72DRAFT_854282 [Pluteus cervinus]|uniref:Uncharacterized protein n=1 Tax=Pluteus cervinus TaxID=181527 RepID=A0ACD3B8H6_9AGAR|nr:hypothetical protein BDN72DRAFT_854282 [Pluteus cervinus]
MLSNLLLLSKFLLLLFSLPLQCNFPLLLNLNLPFYLPLLFGLPLIGVLVKVVTNMYVSGDHYVRFRDSTGREGYHYLNANDTYYFIDTDKTQYYNDGCGYARLTCPSGLKIENRNSTFRLRHFDLMNFDFDLYLQEFQPNLERIKQNNAYYP